MSTTAQGTIDLDRCKEKGDSCSEQGHTVPLLYFLPKSAHAYAVAINPPHLSSVCQVCPIIQFEICYSTGKRPGHW